MTDHGPQADQKAAAAREDSRKHRARLDTGEEAAIRTYTVQVTPEEAKVLAAGGMPPGVRAQIDRTDAEDAVIELMEDQR